MITPEEAIALLRETKPTRSERIQYLLANGYPAYTTQIGNSILGSSSRKWFKCKYYRNINFIGWLGYSDETIRALCRKYLAAGFKAFKMKVGQDLQNDIKRCQLVREEIGWDNQFVSKSCWKCYGCKFIILLPFPFVDD